MSSPIAKANKSGFDKALITGHQTLSHGHRIRSLVELFSAQIRALTFVAPIRILDVGCGDMQLSTGLLEQLDGIELTCVDIYPPPHGDAGSDARWRHYRQFDGHSLPFEHNAFDVVIFSDVLHHVPADRLISLLTSAGSVGRHVMIKDHFEYGSWSRLMLRAMDFVGNYGYGVSVPDRYFSRATFAAVLSAASLRTDHLHVGIRLYDHLPLVRSILSPNWQFLAICSSVGLSAAD